MRDPEHPAYTEICRMWISDVKTLREDNASMIHRLATALKESARRSFIEEAEEFQLAMLEREDLLVLLRHEIKEQLEWLEKQPAGIPAPYSYARLKTAIEQMIREYDHLKSSFLQFIAS